MRKIMILIFILFLSIQFSFAQKNKAPKSIDEAIITLEFDCSDSLKTIIKNLSNDELQEVCYPLYKYHKLFEELCKKLRQWTDKSKVKKYLVSNEISLIQHQRAVILVALKKHLLGEPINEKEIFEPYQKIEKKKKEEEKVKYRTDFLDGIYIPKDLEDCFKQIDSFWDDSTKIKVKQWTENEFCAKTHHGFGMWIRNNWGLWRGSRLSKYFNEMEIFHPDDMSGIILTSYYRYLTENEIKLEDQIIYYQEYWEKKKNEPKKKKK